MVATSGPVSTSTPRTAVPFRLQERCERSAGVPREIAAAGLDDADQRLELLVRGARADRLGAVVRDRPADDGAAAPARPACEPIDERFGPRVQANAEGHM